MELDEPKGTWYWIADFCEVDKEGRIKYFRNDEEIPYPWIIIEDVHESK